MKKAVRVIDKMSFSGIVLYYCGCVKLFKDGDGFGFVFRPWHPVTWLMLVLMIVPAALLGEKLTNIIPLKLSKFWRKNQDQLQWAKPWSNLADFKPFKSPPYKPSPDDRSEWARD